ncbi:Nn.00g103260.m01.CDS01 [Neocucurbitaria sp. VM-36]
MGRTEQSQGLAPPAVRKDIRAKQARHIINKVVPAILTSNARARKGAENSELISDPGHAVAVVKARNNNEVPDSEDTAYVKRKGQGRRKAKIGDGETDFLVREEHESRGKGGRKGARNAHHLDNGQSNMSILSAPPPITKGNRSIRIISTDTLTAAHILTFPSQYSDMGAKPGKKAPNVCILNMASPLRPGGGVLTGATSQEEYLCARTTLLPSLKESFYRLPELGGIWTSDVLVFRSHLPLDDSNGELGPGERYWLDVISAGMLRFPELEGDEDEEKRLGKKDTEMVEAKMRAVLRIAASKGVKKMVLGAWGCGAYGNPVRDIARAWKKVLDGGNNPVSRKSKAQLETETWPGMETIIFAISNHNMAVHFAQAMDCGVEVEAGPRVTTEVEDCEQDKEAEELRIKIQELEGQLSRVWNQDLKSRIGVILEGLKAQLKERGGAAEDDADDDGETEGRSEAGESSTCDEHELPCMNSDEDIQSGGEGRE